jgi:hypothetical protein
MNVKNTPAYYSKRVKCTKLCNIGLDTSGLYYNHITIVNDTSRVTSELCHNLECHSRVVNYDPRGIIFTHL